MSTEGKKYSKEFAESVLAMSGPPKAGQFYKHYNGSIYVVIAVTEEQTDHGVMVIYQGANAKFWTRELSTWYYSMTLQSLPDDMIRKFYADIEVAKILAAEREDFSKREAAFTKELADLCNKHKVGLTTDHTESIWVEDNLGGEPVNEGNVL